MFSHVMVGSNDLARSKVFYDALFQTLGGQPGQQDPQGRLIYAQGGAMFMITTPIDGQKATAGNGSTIAFKVDGPDQADAWHAAGVANGGTSIEDAPGYREAGYGKLYLAYLRDPDGNKLCAIKFEPK